VLKVVAHYGTKPGANDEVLKLLATMAEATRKDPGNISWETSTGTGRASTFWSPVQEKSFPGSRPATSRPIPPR